jgi:hypothetical protein
MPITENLYLNRIDHSTRYQTKKINNQRAKERPIWFLIQKLLLQQKIKITISNLKTQEFP